MDGGKKLVYKYWRIIAEESDDNQDAGVAISNWNPGVKQEQGEDERYIINLEARLNRILTKP